MFACLGETFGNYIVVGGIVYLLRIGEQQVKIQLSWPNNYNIVVSLDLNIRTM